MYENLKWFYYLKSAKDRKGLFPQYESDYVVAKQEMEYSKVVLKFTSFDSIVSLARWIYLGESKHAYEIIRGDKPHRMFFDIDMKSDDIRENSREHVLYIIGEITKAIYTITKSEYVVCESIDSERKKYSFHIIMDCLVSSCKHAKELAVQTVNLIYDNYISRFIDLGVYTHNRQLRAIGSSKLSLNSKQRFKTWSPLSTKKWNETLPIVNILETLVGYTSNKTLFNVDITVPLPNTFDDFEHHDISQDDFNEMIKYIPDWCEIRNTNPSGQRIDLMRKYSSLCPVCNKVHDSENMFLTLRENEIVYWCRRNLKSQKVLGYLSQSKHSVDVNAVSTVQETDDHTSQAKRLYKEMMIHHYQTRRYKLNSSRPIELQ